MKNSLKLPCINQRLTQNSSLLKKNASSVTKFVKKKNFDGVATEPRDEITTTNMSQSSNISPRLFYLDSDASRQFDILNQFEKAVVHSRMSNGGNSNIFKKNW